MAYSPSFPSVLREHYRQSINAVEGTVLAQSLSTWCFFGLILTTLRETGSLRNWGNILHRDHLREAWCPHPTEEHLFWDEEKFDLLGADLRDGCQYGFLGHLFFFSFNFPMQSGQEILESKSTWHVPWSESHFERCQVVLECSTWALTFQC